MTWPFTGPASREASASSLLAERTGLRAGRTSRRVSREAALAHSAVWACRRLRADLISTMPVDVFRKVGGVQVEQTKPPVLVNPGGSTVMLFDEFVYSTQADLDTVGNTVGIILARDGAGLPSVIELADMDTVSFIGSGRQIQKVRVGRDEYDYAQIWHEKQYTKAGSPIGMSPIAHAAMTINSYLSAQEFAADWFANATMPGGHLKNTAKKLNREESLRTKASFKASISAGDLWVSGNDWEYKMLSAKASESQFIEERQLSVVEVCRYLGVPGDMIDAESSSGSITYANVTQRNLQLLIMNLGPAIIRRENALSWGLLPRPRYIKLNTAALLRMDLKSRYEGYKLGIDGRWLPPSRILDLENMPPLTPEEKAEFAEPFPNKQPAPTGGTPS
ncbi:MAG: phage portal protein [Actinobacteria bacterium]|nr:phage portal protein [Actinomycetota bacterium]